MGNVYVLYGSRAITTLILSEEPFPHIMVAVGLRLYQNHSHWLAKLIKSSSLARFRILAGVTSPSVALEDYCVQR